MSCRAVAKLDYAGSNKINNSREARLEHRPTTVGHCLIEQTGVLSRSIGNAT